MAAEAARIDETARSRTVVSQFGFSFGTFPIGGGRGGASQW